MLWIWSLNKMTHQINKFLGRYAHLAPPDLALREAVSKLLSEECGITIPVSKISYKNTIVFVDGSPLLKGELFLRKEALLAALTKEFGAKAPKDIR